MTRREILTTKHTLDYLHSLDYGQATELQIHSKAFGAEFGDPKPSVAELQCVLNNCEREKWINGFPTRFTNKMKWNITELGESVRMEMQ